MVHFAPCRPGFVAVQHALNNVIINSTATQFVPPTADVKAQAVHLLAGLLDVQWYELGSMVCTLPPHLQQVAVAL